MSRRRSPDYDLPTLPEGAPVGEELTEELPDDDESEAAGFEALSTEALFHDAVSQAEGFELPQATELLEVGPAPAGPAPAGPAPQPNPTLARARFRDALVEIRAGNFTAARKHLQLAEAHAPDQRSPGALLSLLANADKLSELESAWAQLGLVGRYGVAAAFGVPVTELREVLIRDAELYGLDLGLPSTVEQLLAGAASLSRAGARPDGEDDPVPFARLSPRL